MLTKETVLQAIKNKRESMSLDGRDYNRLLDFFCWDKETLDVFNVELKDGVKIPEPKKWNKKSILNQLEIDLEFAFEKALNMLQAKY